MKAQASRLCCPLAGVDRMLEKVSEYWVLEEANRSKDQAKVGTCEEEVRKTDGETESGPGQVYDKSSAHDGAMALFFIHVRTPAVRGPAVE
jgi:hypothetical protein